MLIWAEVRTSAHFLLKLSPFIKIMITLSISYSREKELSRVLETIKRLPWYREHGYSETFAKLPLGVNDSSPADEVSTAISNEYDPKLFTDTENSILNIWATVSNNFDELRKLSDIKLSNTYNVILTKYGSGGSYDTATGTIIINIGSAKRRERIHSVIVHEIVHMTIQHLIDKYSVSHWRKERLVDLLLEKYFSTSQISQKIAENVSAVDDAFTKLFPDIDAVARCIGKP
jgi:hypothetical protein